MQQAITKTENAFWGAIKRFFKETFRAHTKKEYSDFFARSGEGNYKTYPFIWLRVLALEIIIFAVVLIISEFTGFDTFYAYSVLTGGLLLNIPVFIFIYELYPGRDLGFLKYFLAFFIGGVVSIALTLLVYYAYEPSNAYISALWTGFVEELFKAVPVIVMLIAFRNRSPLFGFLIGAAVGAGVSVIEDMCYIHGEATAWGFVSNSWQQLIYTSVSRGLSAGCTHTLWTALIGWAFCKFKKPLLNFRFYGVAVLCVALHFVWDLPLEEWASALVCLGLSAVVLVLGAIIFYRERKKLFGAANEEQPEQLTLEEVAIADAAVARGNAFGLSHIANIVAAVCLTVIAVFVVGLCYSDWGFVNTKNVYFDSIPELYNYVQDGLPIDREQVSKREYDDSVKFEDNYAYAYVNGERVSAIQTVKENKDGYEFEYYYSYEFELDEENNVRVPELYFVNIDVNGVNYSMHTLYNYNGDKLVYFTKGDPSIWFNDELGKYYVEEKCDMYFYGVWETVAVCSVMGVIGAGGIAAFTTLKIKSRREKNVG